MIQQHTFPLPVRSSNKKRTNRSIATAILDEVAASLARFIETGQTAVIDLRNQPWMHESTYRTLRDALGTGEVAAVIDADRKIEITETQYSGVWWLTHRNEQGAIVTELIEITEIPDILKPHAAEMRAGLKRLEQALATSAPPHVSPATSTALQ